ncbi:MAG: glycosyltransferase family 4 protein [Patescibacteria group bacterium]|nr:glycosyltransferase family 4 protein [Patescibacteria group bacterium]MCL5095135.1 glycosyltransferase family 4 protein [Patescibacteria group bacterium]
MKQPNIIPNTKYQILNTKYFLYVGNAYPHKNLERLLEAIASIKYSVLGIKLILVGGEDHFYKQLKKKVEVMGLTESVSFYGPAKREELTSLYQKALALVFPSLMEGFGLPGLEAMASSCLVVCSDIPVFREIYGEGALYFDPQNPKDIAEKLKMVCSNVLKQQNKEEMIRKGQEQVKKYSWDKLARETFKIYQEVSNL